MKPKQRLIGMLLGLLMCLSILPGTSHAQGDGIEFKVSYDDGTGIYSVYMRSNNTPIDKSTLTSQVTIKVPHATGGDQFVPRPEPFIAFVPTLYTGPTVGPSWSVGSRADGPTEDTDADYISWDLAMGADLTLYDWQAGQEILVFQFTNLGTCQGAVEIMLDSDPFASQPNSVGTNPGNQISARGMNGTTDNDFIGAYDTGSADCTGGGASPDSDGDGLTDDVDPDDDNDGIPDATEGAGDMDSDGIPDSLEHNTQDTDGDGNPDYNDPNADEDGEGNDGTSGEQNGVESGPWNDADGDGIPAHLDPNDGAAGPGDADNDTINDDVECPNGYLCPDSDGDGIPDYMDTDSDNDGTDDQTEGAGDADSDGLPDRVEPDNVDTDDDGLMDQNDPDDDGDGTNTNAEGGADGDPTDDDADMDGIPDHLDADN
ncbi:MAG: hypothetical protein AAF702_33300, partial [Chloroflexota bacterium]